MELRSASLQITKQDRPDLSKILKFFGLLKLTPDGGGLNQPRK